MLKVSEILMEFPVYEPGCNTPVNVIYSCELTSDRIQRVKDPGSKQSLGLKIRIFRRKVPLTHVKSGGSRTADVKIALEFHADEKGVFSWLCQGSTKVTISLQ